MEATVLLKVLEETDRCTLSFDMDGSGGSDTDALLAWKILLSQGYEGHLLWDCAADELRDGCHVILTDYVAWPSDQSS